MKTPNGPRRPSGTLEEVLRQCRAHESRARRVLQLIASENSLSPLAREALSSDLGARYALGRQGERQSAIAGWYFPNTSRASRIEQLLELVAGRLFNARYLDFRPLSGTGALQAVLNSVLSSGDVLMKISPRDGGHTATERLAVSLGVQVQYLAGDQASLSIDVGRSRALIAAAGPRLVMLDSSKLLFPHPVAELAEVLPARCILSFDGSHVLGLIAGGLFQDPLREGAAILHGSLHKSFPGPQKGVVMTNRSDVAEALFGALAFLVSNSHLNVMTALAVSMFEMEEFGASYGAQVVRNAKALARALFAAGFLVLGENRDFTESHQLFLDVDELGAPLEMVKHLEACGIFVNQCSLPFNGKSGIRIGVQEMTRYGMKEEEMVIIAALMEGVLRNRISKKTAMGRVRDLRQQFAVVGFCNGEL